MQNNLQYQDTNMLEHKHLLLMADVHNPLTVEPLAENWMLGLISDLKMRPLIEPKAVYCNIEGNRGLTCICAIETSHIVLHIWDEPIPAKMQLDIYTCSSLNMTTVWKAMRSFEPFDIHYKFYDRESGFIPLNNIEAKRIEKNLLKNTWHFAKTMPQIPHWYTRGREWSSLDEFAEAVDLINLEGIEERWGNRTYKYYHIDGYKYWTMEEPDVPSHKHILINRAKA